jgi:hypothetical protein
VKLQKLGPVGPDFFGVPERGSRFSEHALDFADEEFAVKEDLQ